MSAVWNRVRTIVGVVRLRQLADQFRHRLSFVPGLYVLAAILLVQVTLWIDRSIGVDDIPQFAATTVDSARSLFTAISGGLITSITLLLSMMLVAVQLASSQFSPRTLRDWLGDQYLKHTIGITLGTTVFSLLALRSTRSFSEDGDAVVPHTSVLVVVLLGVISLFAVVGSVDHITQSLRIGSVARRIADDTIRVIEHGDGVGADENPTQVPSTGSPTSVGSEAQGDDVDVPTDAAPIEAPESGWVQQISATSIVDALPEGSTGYVVVPLGGFVPSATPLMWVAPAPPDDDPCRSELLEAFALGDTRTLQQDVGYGIVQLTDIAVRALSPGVNDPSTANDLIVHLGDVLLALWSQPLATARVERDGRVLIRREPSHGEHLRRAFDPIRRYGASDPVVTMTLVRTLRMIRSEVSRRELPGPIEPLDEMIDAVFAGVESAGWARHERDELERLQAGVG